MTHKSSNILLLYDTQNEYTPDYCFTFLIFSATFKGNSETIKFRLFESPNVKILESGKKLAMAMFLRFATPTLLKNGSTKGQFS
jgi:hypothetical protein